jgi:protein import protein ZIM17
LRISQTKAALPKLSHWLVVVSGLVDGNSETYPEAGSSDLNEVCGFWLFDFSFIFF